jgi:hypothetical protein
MISTNLVKVFYTDGYYETSDMKTIVGVILHKDHSSITIGLIEKEILLNWNHVVKIESIHNKGLPSFFRLK